MTDTCPLYGHFFAAMGCMAAISLCSIGASYATAKSGVGVAAAGILRPDLIVKSMIPIVMGGVIAIYGLAVSVLITDNLKANIPLPAALIYLGAGLSAGLTGLSAGFAVGIVGDAGVRGSAQQPRLYVGMVVILIFAEVLGLYGTIIALIMNGKAAQITEELKGFC